MGDTTKLPDGARLLIDEALDELLITPIEDELTPIEDELAPLAAGPDDELLLGTPLDVALELAPDGGVDHALELLRPVGEEVLLLDAELPCGPEELLLFSTGDELEESREVLVDELELCARGGSSDTGGASMPSGGHGAAPAGGQQPLPA